MYIKLQIAQFDTIGVAKPRLIGVQAQSIQLQGHTGNENFKHIRRYVHIQLHIYVKAKG